MKMHMAMEYSESISIDGKRWRITARRTENGFTLIGRNKMGDVFSSFVGFAEAPEMSSAIPTSMAAVIVEIEDEANRLVGALRRSDTTIDDYCILRMAFSRFYNSAANRGS